MSLPTEVVDHILSFLQSDLAILRTCAQSHPILSKLSSRYIYAHISLHDDLYDTVITTGLRTSELTQTLANTPDIANHVRNLTVFCLTGNSGFKQHEATISHLNGVASTANVCWTDEVRNRGKLEQQEFCMAYNARGVLPSFPTPSSPSGHEGHHYLQHYLLSKYLC